MKKHILGIIGAAIFFGAAIGAAVFFAEPLPIFEHEWTFVYNFVERTPDGIVEHKDFCEGEKEKALVEVLSGAKRKRYKDVESETEDIKYIIYLQSKEGFLTVNLWEGGGEFQNEATGLGYEITNPNRLMAEIEALLEGNS